MRAQRKKIRKTPLETATTKTLPNAETLRGRHGIRTVQDSSGGLVLLNKCNINLFEFASDN